MEFELRVFRISSDVRHIESWKLHD
jgi:hypothetical protein